MSAWTIQSVREAIAAKNVSARELAAEFYKRIQERNPLLNAFLTLCPDRASTQAQRIDGLVAAKKPLPPLAGEVSDRKSTRLNSSHANISYAVFCLKKKKTS